MCIGVSHIVPDHVLQRQSQAETLRNVRIASQRCRVPVRHNVCVVRYTGADSLLFAILLHQVGIMLDTKGPEIRTGMLANGKGIQLEKGQTLEITTDYEVWCMCGRSE